MGGQGRRDLGGKESEMKYHMKKKYDLGSYTPSNLNKKKIEKQKEAADKKFSGSEILFSVILFLFLIVVIISAFSRGT